MDWDAKRLVEFDNGLVVGRVSHRSMKERSYSKHGRVFKYSSLRASLSIIASAPAPAHSSTSASASAWPTTTLDDFLFY